MANSFAARPVVDGAYRKHPAIRLLGTLLVLIFASPIPTAIGATGEILNGFDLSEASIPSDEVKGGGPPRDGIPALNDPPREIKESKS